MSKAVRILIVDDDYKFRETLASILMIKGYRPIEAATGKSALKRVEEERPAIALIDLKLTDISGLEVLARIKELYPDTECIVITGHASQNSAIEAINLGAYGFVEKPFDVGQLLVFIRRAMEKQEAQKALQESEEKYRELINATIDGIISIDSDMNIILWNPGAERIFGYEQKEIIGHKILKIIPERYRRLMEKGYEGFKRNGRGQIIGKTLELVGLKKDGTEVPIEISISSRKIGGVFVSTAVARDISERKRMEEELRNGTFSIEEQLQEYLKKEQEVDYE